jgi:hypothetical protein
MPAATKTAVSKPWKNAVAAASWSLAARPACPLAATCSDAERDAQQALGAVRVVVEKRDR